MNSEKNPAALQAGKKEKREQRGIVGVAELEIEVFLLVKDKWKCFEQQRHHLGSDEDTCPNKRHCHSQTLFKIRMALAGLLSG